MSEIIILWEQKLAKVKTSEVPNVCPKQKESQYLLNLDDAKGHKL